MVDSNLLTVLIVFVGLCALSQVGQFLAMFGLYRKVREIQTQAVPLLGKAEAALEAAKSTLESAKGTIEDSRKQVAELSRKTNQILDSTNAQMTKIDQVITDASGRALSQLEKVDLVLGDTVDRVQGLVTSTHDGIMSPLRELNALAAGLKGGFGFLFGTKRPAVNRVTQDEEMFI